MRTEALIQDHTDSASSHQFQVHTDESSFHADEFEARIQRVSDRYRNLNADAHLVQLKGGRYVCDPQLDLHVKVEAVHWMLRIAKYMNESAREVVFLRVENSLRQLEAAVESRPRPVHSGAPTERLFRSAH
jgi:hypothetical protein